MKGPICNVCLNSDIMCISCKKKVESGDVKDIDITVLKTLNNISKEFKPLADVEIKKIVEGEKILVIVTKQGDGPRIIGKKGVMVKKISKLIGKPLRVVEDCSDVKEFIEKLITPIPIVGINVIYSPEGEILKVLIPRGRKIPMSKSSFGEIVNIMFSKKAIVANG